MPNLDQDKRFLSAGISVLSDYLLSKELFYPLGGDLPRLTLGNLLLAQKRLSSFGDVEQSSQLETIRSKGHVAWEQKATREVHTRRELWSNFLGDYRALPDMNADRFSVEVRHRAILNLLLQETEKSLDWNQLLPLDSLLRGCLVPGDFVWEKQVAPAFDKNDYWFLYGRLKSK
jgi:hypothetical protein